MKNILSAVLLIFSMNIYSQNISIENDELYQQFEKEYKKISLNSTPNDLDLRISSFNSKLGDKKNSSKFYKSKDKEQWLTKNVSKTKFISSQEAIADFNKINSLEAEQALIGQEARKLREELIKRYDSKLVWETLKSRLAKKE